MACPDGWLGGARSRRTSAAEGLTRVSSGVCLRPSSASARAIQPQARLANSQVLRDLHDLLLPPSPAQQHGFGTPEDTVPTSGLLFQATSVATDQMPGGCGGSGGSLGRHLNRTGVK